ncbi:MAG: BON domain-containing protein [Nitrospiraceae bacterium]
MWIVYVSFIALAIPGIGPCAGLAEMQVRTNERRNDDEIADRAKAALSWNVFVELYRISVSVNDGILFLAGVVDSYFERLRAEYAVFPVEGVRNVVNRLETASERTWKRDEELRRNMEGNFRGEP